MTKHHQKIHPNFKINSVPFSSLGFLKQNEDSPVFDKCLLNFFTEWLNDNPKINLQTSGSTGNPKKITALKYSMILSAKNTGKYFNLKEGDRALLCLPLDFIAGKMMVVRAMVLGLNLFISKPSGNPINEFSKEYDFAAMTPYQLDRVVSNVKKIKCLIIGGSPVGDSLKRVVENKTSGVFETFGMTETLSHIAIKNLSNGEEVFSAIPGVTFSVKNEYLKITAPFVSKTPIITKDKVDLISSTKFKWIGRASAIINSGGIKFSPESIERSLNKYYSQPFVICGLPDKNLGEKIVLIFENNPPRDFQQYFNKLKRHEKPKAVFSLSNFKRINGKIDRKDIKIKILEKIKNGK